MSREVRWGLCSATEAEVASQPTVRLRKGGGSVSGFHVPRRFSAMLGPALPYPSGVFLLTLSGYLCTMYFYSRTASTVE